MSAPDKTSANPAAISNQGQYHAKVPKSEPMMTGGHAIGTQVGNDAAPSFHAQVLPAGSAPSDRTFTPNTQNSIPGQAMNPNIAKETWTRAEDTLQGATSGDVHAGLGKPVQGQSSKELHDGSSGEKGVMGRGGAQEEGAERKGERFDEGAKIGGGFEGAEERAV